MPDYPVTVQMWKTLSEQVAELAKQVAALAGVVDGLSKEVNALKTPAAAPAKTEAARKSVWD
jgi:outer membrane murein-binding lipoprotein Lpp